MTTHYTVKSCTAYSMESLCLLQKAQKSIPYTTHFMTTGYVVIIQYVENRHTKQQQQQHSLTPRKEGLRPRARISSRRIFAASIGTRHFLPVAIRLIQPPHSSGSETRPWVHHSVYLTVIVSCSCRCRPEEARLSPPFRHRSSCSHIFQQRFF